MTPLRRLSLLMLFGLLLVACDQEPARHSERLYVLGTLVDVTAYTDDPTQVVTATAAIRKHLQAFDRHWHAWDEHSRLVAINRALQAGETVTLDAAETALIATALDLSERSHGHFNPVIGRLVAAWGFHRSESPGGPPPASDWLDAWRTDPPDAGAYHLEGNALSQQHPLAQLDLGAIAKGTAVELALDALREAGIEAGLVNAGGDLKVIGEPPGRPWRIGIRAPRGEGVLGAVTLRDGEALFTSGDYERRFEHNGQRYHHLLDPVTGMPAHHAMSVTVLHPDADLADAAATALFVAPADERASVAERLGVDAYAVVDGDGQIIISPAMAERLTLSDDWKARRIKP